MTVPSRRLARWTRRAGLCLSGLALAVLTACGGDTSRVEAYVPTGLVVFGDEHSLLTSAGHKYAINTINSTTSAIDCTLGPIWVQAVANVFGFVFAECNPTAKTTAAVMKAALGARVADVRAQVAAYTAANGAFTSSTLVTVMAGMHDVLDAYKAFDAGTLTRDQALAQAGTVGASLGQLVNELTNSGQGARVIYATVPDISYSPYALAQKAAKTDIDRAALINDLVDAFNSAYRLAVTNEGSWAALVIVDDMIDSMANNATAYTLANVKDAACTVALPDCTAATLVSGASANTTYYLWADDLHFGMNTQTRLGTIAAYRAQNNPF